MGPHFGAEGEERAAVANASCLVGMHPDEATDWIVDTALREGKPFAVVPCCVFSDLFARRTAEGKAVTTYDGLVRHLLAKDPSVRLSWLPFEGKNCVVYRVAATVDADAGADGSDDRDVELGAPLCVPCDE